MTETISEAEIEQKKGTFDEGASQLNAESPEAIRELARVIIRRERRMAREFVVEYIRKSKKTDYGSGGYWNAKIVDRYDSRNVIRMFWSEKQGRWVNAM